MNSSANNSFDPTHSSDSGSDDTPDSSSVYAERYSARSPNDTLLADTQLLATPATNDELLSDAFQRYFPMSEVTDLTKHLLSLLLLQRIPRRAQVPRSDRQDRIMR